MLDGMKSMPLGKPVVDKEHLVVAEQTLCALTRTMNFN